MTKQAAGKRQRESCGIHRALRLTCCLLPFGLCLSCSSLPQLPWTPVAKDARAGFYQTARLEYRIDAGKLGQPLDVVRVDGRKVAYEQIASSPLEQQSTGTLVIQHPHPAGRQGMARVTFSLDSIRSVETETGLNPFKSGKPAATITPQHEEVHEVWAMDIPSAESDRYFKLVSTENFYQGTAATDGPTELAVTIDGRELRKTWPQVTELNLLVQRVRREGQLVGYLRPQALAGNPSIVIASTQAYREMVARCGPRGSSGLAPPADTKMARLPYAAR